MTVVLRRDVGLAVITFARPEALNALDVPSMELFRNALLEFRDDDSLAVAIIRGDGDRAFCVGADLKNTMPSSAGFATDYFGRSHLSATPHIYTQSLSMDLLAIHKPVIAAVNGHALGGGLEIALACDLRIASTNATFGLPEARWATVPAFGGISRLVRAVPHAVAMKMLLTGECLGAQAALDYGLISDLVAPADLEQASLALARAVAANGPLAVRAIKETVARGEDLPLSQAIALEQIMWGLLRDTDDRIEGRNAFTERRDPTFRGS